MVCSVWLRRSLSRSEVTAIGVEPGEHLVAKEQPAAPGELWARRVLRVPLTAKIAGANLLALSLSFWAGLEVSRRLGAGDSVVLPVAALLAAVAASVILAWIALGPVRSITRTAERVLKGDFTARVPELPLAEERVERVGDTINRLLEAVAADRARMRMLASQVISAADKERARLARELHDSTAQSLAALSMQLSALHRDQPEGELRDRIESLRELSQEAMEEVRMLAHTLHPRVLDDLGLAAALQNLARRVQQTTDARVETAAMSDEGMAPYVASVLYRVAQESVHNAVRHAEASLIRMELTRGRDAARLEVMDDGRGFNVADAERRRPGMGLFTMRERLGLIGGTMEVISSHGGGTRVIATVPLDAEGDDAR
jgi:signal transduction histidine kinase